MPIAAQSFPGPLVSSRGTRTSRRLCICSRPMVGSSARIEHSFRRPRRPANDVEAPVVAVDEINITVPRWSPHDAVARGFAIERMTRRVALQVGLNLHNRSAARPGGSVANEQLAEQFGRDDVSSRLIECPRQRAKRAGQPELTFAPMSWVRPRPQASGARVISQSERGLARGAARMATRLPYCCLSRKNWLWFVTGSVSTISLLPSAGMFGTGSHVTGGVRFVVVVSEKPAVLLMPQLRRS